MSGNPSPELIDQISAAHFGNWYRERQWTENIREGQPYFNGPSPVTPPEKHSPSSLLQCQRRQYYRAMNAPEETGDPKGIFWSGSQFEEHIILPYFQDVANGDADTFVTNSIWVDFTVQHSGTDLRFKGATDPCFVDRDANPLLPTEIKTKRSVESLETPNQHHRAQLHAYMAGLSRDVDDSIDEGLIVYGSRETLDIQVFHETFDDDFWETICEWATVQSRHRQTGELPPAAPEHEWECSTCSFAHRCGEASSEYSDRPARGLLPYFDGYPREKVKEYLDAHDDAELTPTLARTYPDLAGEYSVASFWCGTCSQSIPGDDPRITLEADATPVCPNCAETDTLSTLHLPAPPN